MQQVALAKLGTKFEDRPAPAQALDVAFSTPQSQAANNQSINLRTREVLMCQCQVQIEYKSKDEKKCSSLGFFDDSVDSSRAPNLRNENTTLQSFGNTISQKLAVFSKYRRMCCKCFNERNIRADLEPLRAKHTDLCAQCIGRISSGGHS